MTKAAKQLGGGSKVLMRKTKFPFPVKLSGANYTPKQMLDNVREAILGTHLLLGGGKDFIIQCSTTESLSIKESVKNVMQSVLRLVCIVIFAQEKSNKHNYIEEISLQTTKSVALSVFEQDKEEEDKIAEE